MEEIILDIDTLCYDKDAVNKMQSKITELKSKLNKLSPLSQQVNKILFTFVINMLNFLLYYYYFTAKFKCSERDFISNQ